MVLSFQIIHLSPGWRRCPSMYIDYFIAVMALGLIIEFAGLIGLVISLWR